MNQEGISEAKRRDSFWRRAYSLYADGFRNMSKTSRTLWVIIFIKLFIMFAILRVFFFPRVVNRAGDKQQQVHHVVEELTKDEYTEGEIPLWYAPTSPEENASSERSN